MNYALYFACVQFIQNGSIKIIPAAITVSQRAKEKWEEPNRDGWKLWKIIYEGWKGIEAKTEQ